MNLLQRRYRAWITPYAEGTLDARRCDKLEARLAHDPVLAAEVEAERRVVARLRAVAQAETTTSDARNLWPAIQSRLEPRRSLIRPLILVGGLSAAATSLLWASLWGPLGHPPPFQPLATVATNAAEPNVIVMGPIQGRRTSHPGRRVRHNGEHLAKRFPANRPAEPTGSGGSTRSAADSPLLATRDVLPPAADGGEEREPTAPPFPPTNPGHFHLATSEHSVSHGTDQNEAPIGQTGSSADASVKPLSDGADTGRSGGTSVPPEKAVPATSSRTPTEQPKQTSAPRRQRSGQRRRHRHPGGHSKTDHVSSEMRTSPDAEKTPAPASGGVSAKAPTKPID